MMNGMGWDLLYVLVVHPG